MMNKRPPYIRGNKPPQHNAGNIFFMLFGAVALIGAFTVGSSNIIKGLVTSMSDVTRKTIAEEKMNGAARISIMDATTSQPNDGDCDEDGMVEPLPYRDAGTGPHPTGGGWVPQDIGATTKDPWGTEFGYCVWDMGATTVSDNDPACGGNTAKRLEGAIGTDTVVAAVISAGKDRKFQTSCAAAPPPADCTGLGAAHYNDPASGHCYYRSTSTATYAAAQTACQAAGGYLAAITSNAEGVTIASQLSLSADTVFVGMDDIAAEGVWRWSGGEVYGVQFWNGDGTTGTAVGGLYNHWWAPDPNDVANEDCGTISGYGNGDPNVESAWRDSTCGTARKYICEKSSGAGAAIVRGANSDDVILEYTYNDASGMSGDDLWKAMDTKPDTATIDKNIDVTGDSSFGGAFNLMDSGLILPDDSMTGACVAASDQQIRVNYTANPPTLEICDFTGGGTDWEAVSTGGSGAQVDSDMLAWFKFDETTGASAANSTGGTSGTLVNMTNADWVAGHIANGLDFDGINDYVNAGSDAKYDNLFAFTVCSWVWMDASGAGFIASKYNASGDGWAILGNGTGSAISVDISGAGNTTGAVVSSNTWHHICVPWDSATDSTPAIYMDGALLLAGTAGTGTVEDDNAGSLVIGGADPAHPNIPFKGKIDDVQIYARKLKAQEINYIYTNETALTGNEVFSDGPAAVQPDTFLKNKMDLMCTSTAGDGPLTRLATNPNVGSSVGRAGFSNGGYSYTLSDQPPTRYISAWTTAAGGIMTRVNQTANGSTATSPTFSHSGIIISPRVGSNTAAYSFNGTTFAAAGTISSMLVQHGWSDGSYTYTIESTDIKAYTYNAGTFTLAGTYNIGESSTHIWGDGRYVYVTGDTKMFVLTFNGATFTKVLDFSIPNNSYNSFGDGRYLYVAGTSPNSLSIYTFDGTAATLVKTYSSLPFGFTGTDGVNLFGTSTTNGLAAYRFDGANLKPVATYPGNYAAPWTDGTFLYAQQAATGYVDVFSGLGCGISNAPSI